MIDQKWNQDHIDDVEFFIVGGDNLLTNVVYNIYD